MFSYFKLALKKVYPWYDSGHIDDDAIDEHLNKELKNMFKKSKS